MASDIIQSVDRALEFLIYLYNEGKETSVTQIANDLGVYKSTVFRTLQQWEARGFVKKKSGDGEVLVRESPFYVGKECREQDGASRDCETVCIGAL